MWQGFFRLPLEGGGNAFVVVFCMFVAVAKGIVKIHAGEDGENIGLEQGHKDLQPGERDKQDERGHRACRKDTHTHKQNNKGCKDFEEHVACDHVGGQTHGEGERAGEEGDNLQRDNERRQIGRGACGQEVGEEMETLFINATPRTIRNTATPIKAVVVI